MDTGAPCTPTLAHTHTHSHTFSIASIRPDEGARTLSEESIFPLVKCAHIEREKKFHHEARWFEEPATTAIQLK